MERTGLREATWWRTPCAADVNIIIIVRIYLFFWCSIWTLVRVCYELLFFSISIHCLSQKFPPNHNEQIIFWIFNKFKFNYNDNIEHFYLLYIYFKCCKVKQNSDKLWKHEKHLFWWFLLTTLILKYQCILQHKFAYLFIQFCNKFGSFCKFLCNISNTF